MVATFLCRLSETKRGDSKKNVYSLSEINDTLDALGGTKYFSTLDFASGYWQVDLDDDAKAKSAFTL